MKKIICLILSLILVTGFCCFAAADQGDGDYYVYIGLKYMSNAVSSIDITCDDGFIFADIGRNGFTVNQDFSMYNSITVANSGGTAVAYDSAGNILIESIGPAQGFVSANADPDSRIVKIGGTSYRDGVFFGAYSASSSYPGMLGVANYVTLEHYLWGVINNELGYYNPSEALKAQAVASRSFTLANLNKHGGGALSFDLCFRTHCQAYGGVSSEHAETTAACRATEGIVVAYDGKVACTYFHAYNGGYTMNADDVWSASLGYLRAVPDEYTSLHSWATSFSFEELETILTSSGRTISNITSVKVGERLANGAVNSLIFEGTGGPVYLTKNNIMDLLKLKSRWFSMGASGYLPAGLVSGSAAYSQPAEESFANLYIYSGSGLKEITDTACVATESGTYQVSIDGLVVYDGAAYTALSADQTRTAGGSQETEESPFTDEICTDGMIYLSGVGYGHGVGICQTGMTNRANAGQTYEQIICAYLTDIELVNYSSLGY